MSSKLVYISDNSLFAELEPKEGCFNDIMPFALPCLYDDVEMSGFIGAHAVVVSPQSMVGNHPLHGLGSQLPQRKDHEGFTKRDAHHVPALINGC